MEFHCALGLGSFFLRPPNGPTYALAKFPPLDQKLTAVNPYYAPSLLNEAVAEAQCALEKYQRLTYEYVKWWAILDLNQ